MEEGGRRNDTVKSNSSSQELAKMTDFNEESHYRLVSGERSSHRFDPIAVATVSTHVAIRPVSYALPLSLQRAAQLARIEIENGRKLEQRANLDCSIPQRSAERRTRVEACRIVVASSRSQQA